MEKLRVFRDIYVPDGGTVLDVGSWSTGAFSARDVFTGSRYRYVGLDIQPGRNVDVVVADPYRWQEVERESVDAVVSSATFEHNPFFWITAAEIARVLRQGGYACVVAPSSGGVHRYPLDCWRFYPDATAALAGYTGLEPVESYQERPRFRKVTFGQRWRDHMSILCKPQIDDPEGFYRRLDAIVATRAVFPAPPPEGGPAAAAYERAQTAGVAHAARVRAALVYHRLTHRLQPSGLW